VRDDEPPRDARRVRAAAAAAQTGTGRDQTGVGRDSTGTGRDQTNVLPPQPSAGGRGQAQGRAAAAAKCRWAGTSARTATNACFVVDFVRLICGSL